MDHLPSLESAQNHLYKGHFWEIFGHFKSRFRGFLAQKGRMLRYFWLPETQDSSLVLYKENKMVKQLSKASGTAKQSKLLAVAGCQEIF